MKLTAFLKNSLKILRIIKKKLSVFLFQLTVKLKFIFLKHNLISHSDKIHFQDGTKSIKIEAEDEVDDLRSDTSSPTFLKQFSKCDKCRRSRTKVLVPNSILSVTFSKNDGVTCDFCGNR
jgi:hypothetical protein